ncbi:MAG: hypothetical protein R3B84_16030 [Zavarzinella sp.]
MERNVSLRNFWDSPEVFHITDSFLSKISKDESIQLRSLPKAIRYYNTKGRILFRKPFCNTFACLDAIPDPDDGSTTYIEFRKSLGIFADLLKMFREKVEQEFGKECWKKPEELLEDEPKKRLLFDLLVKVSGSPRSDAIDYLENVSRKGIRHYYFDIEQAKFRSRDCGFEHLVKISKWMVRVLELSKPTDPAPPNEPTLVAKRRATVDVVNSNAVKIQYNNKICILSGRKRELFLKLFHSINKFASHENIWNHIFRNECRSTYKPNPKGGGPPDNLRQIKSKLDRKLLVDIGLPPQGTSWITSLKNQGYVLNQSITWQIKGYFISDRSPEIQLVQDNQISNKGNC